MEMKIDEEDEHMILSKSWTETMTKAHKELAGKKYKNMYIVDHGRINQDIILIGHKDITIYNIERKEYITKEVRCIRSSLSEDQNYLVIISHNN